MDRSSTNGAPPALAKRAFYSRPAIAAAYDEQRFGGPSGAWVNARELALVRALLPPGGSVLDLACGTGRVTGDLAGRGYRVVGLDGSAEMLRAARARAAAPFARGDAFALPFGDGRFDAVVALRLVFHFREVGPLLAEMARVVRPGGRLVFDTYRWTPRALIALAAGRWGGKVFVHPPRPLVGLARGLGLEVRSEEACFLFSPYVYRLLPLPVVHALARLEAVVPPALRARIFWAFERTG